MKNPESNMQQELTALPNVGKVLAGRLKQVGIQTPEQLRTLGAEQIFIRRKAVDPGACINELMAIEGAIQGVRWHDLDGGTKERLKAFYEQTKLK